MQEIVEEGLGPLVVQTDLPGVEPDGDEMIGGESEIDVLRRGERLREHRGAGEQRQRAGDLPAHQQPSTTAAGDPDFCENSEPRWGSMPSAGK